MINAIFFFFFFLNYAGGNKRGLFNGGTMLWRCPRQNLGPTWLYSVYYYKPH